MNAIVKIHPNFPLIFRVRFSVNPNPKEGHPCPSWEIRPCNQPTNQPTNKQQNNKETNKWTNKLQNQQTDTYSLTTESKI